jgi:hypothetical protein
MGLRIKKLHWKLELAKDCKLVFEQSKPNGHDCWGNLDWYTYKAVHFKGKIQQIWDDQWILHNDKEIKDVMFDFSKEMRYGK